MTDPQPTLPRYNISSTGAPTSIDAWSSLRLPFEPDGWPRDFRHDLQIAIRTLNPQPATCLHAIYTSPSNDRCDVDNILFYNLGPATFAHAMGSGVRFERVIAIPPACPTPIANDRPLVLHHYHYAFAPYDASWQSWLPNTTLATWEVSLESSDLKGCATLWRAMKRGSVKMLAERAAGNDPFGLKITLAGPKRSTSRLQTQLKPLLDGVISALHRYDGEPPSDVCRLIAGRLGEDDDTVHTWLTDRVSSVLDPRALVHTFRTGIQWNPADDACYAGDIRITEMPGQLTLRGEVMTLRAAPVAD